MKSQAFFQKSLTFSHLGDIITELSRADRVSKFRISFGHPQWRDWIEEVNNMYAVINIITPTKLDRRQKSLLQDLAKTDLEDSVEFKNFKKYLK